MGDPWAESTISGQEFQLIQRLVKEHTGIALSEHKRSLVASRLGKRLRALKLESFRRYYDYLVGESGATELENFVNAMTTNKTDFYRERAHFDFLQREVIPNWKARAARTGERRVRIWSAGCSTGEEAYTIALTLCEGLGSLLSWDIRILASDIDTDVLAHAAEGVYSRERAADVPTPLLQRYFLQGRGDSAGFVKVGREIRSLVTFRRINFQDDPWPIHTSFDCIFCRNVIIYFDKPTQHHLLGRFAGYLKDDGHLFLGHSESLHGISDCFAFLHNTIYRKSAEAGAGARTAEMRAS